MDRTPQPPPTDDHRRPDPGRRRGRALLAGAVALALTAGVSTAAALEVAAGPTTVAAAAVPDRHGYGSGDGQDGSGQSAQQTTRATAQQQTGVVDVDTVLDYGTGEAAGTGIVLTPDGEILTNNHVVEGSTSIKVTDVTSGKTYTATVVGTDATDDVAVIRLQGASGLTPATLASTDAQNAVTTGTPVTAVGNAGGTGGTPSAAAGTVVALGQTITASDETSTADSENLAGMIEVQAGIESGDSGGPLYANGAVIGVDTAASSSSGPSYRTAADSGGRGADDRLRHPDRQGPPDRRPDHLGRLERDRPPGLPGVPRRADRLGRGQRRVVGHRRVRR
jgi:S1-C subfamily serine protease